MRNAQGLRTGQFAEELSVRMAADDISNGDPHGATVSPIQTASGAINSSEQLGASGPLPVEPSPAERGGQLQRSLKGLIRGLLHRLGYDVIHYRSASIGERFGLIVESLAREENYRSALILRGVVSSGCGEAFVRGASKNSGNPTIVYRRAQEYVLDSPEDMVVCRASNEGHGCAISARACAPGYPGEAPEVIVFDGESCQSYGSYLSFHPRLIVVGRTNSYTNYAVLCELRSNAEYELVCQDPSERDGYAVFRKVAAPRVLIGSDRFSEGECA